MFVKITSSCYVERARKNVDEIIELDRRLAMELIGAGRAEETEAPKPPKKVEKEKSEARKNVRRTTKPK